MREVYGEEIRRAKRAWEARHDAELSWAEIARRCEAILGRRVFPEQIIRFKDQKQEPKLAEFRAMAIVLETEPRAAGVWLSTAPRRDPAGARAAHPGRAPEVYEAEASERLDSPIADVAKPSSIFRKASSTSLSSHSIRPCLLPETSFTIRMRHGSSHPGASVTSGVTALRMLPTISAIGFSYNLRCLFAPVEMHTPMFHGLVNRSIMYGKVPTSKHLTRYNHS